MRSTPQRISGMQRCFNEAAGADPADATSIYAGMVALETQLQ